MKTANITESPVDFSALLAEAEAGEPVLILRQGQPVARLVAEPARSAPFDLGALRDFVQAGPCHASPTVAEMRENNLL
ncbi:Antitoxin Phd_YefM, type II toxin-antitoxin system [Methylomagnum ishizawai]|uniref:Antitoxin n=1 Tax=Methylomagnum ishizawai TaxID=1760988 RepID=A0A1Y6D756_9GAMM|nr:type II toxin-antitoxin system Phd/YefM family antitoxin [Methylomagnum ishizawai]SMF96342.1 Antitoxin Phd_YefM, type II toxin-antitoxin system [Methylomagnum ishizawai]